MAKTYYVEFQVYANNEKEALEDFIEWCNRDELELEEEFYYQN